MSNCIRSYLGIDKLVQALLPLQERMLDFIAKQVERGKAQSSHAEEPTYTELQRESSQERLTLNIQLKRKVDGKLAVYFSLFSSNLNSLNLFVGNEVCGTDTPEWA